MEVENSLRIEMRHDPLIDLHQSNGHEDTFCPSPGMRKNKGYFVLNNMTQSNSLRTVSRLIIPAELLCDRGSSVKQVYRYKSTRHACSGWGRCFASEWFQQCDAVVIWTHLFVCIGLALCGAMGIAGHGVVMIII